jgi:RIO-like serine/threonine protein kinase
MAWPTPQDYNEAVQNPHLNFSDAELKAGDLEVTPMGLPRVASGAFASVYRMHTGKRDVAVRCFLHNVEDQQRRYEAISRFITGDPLDCTVDFDYLENGVRVSGAWYPVLKMEWASGVTLDAFVRANLRNAEALRKLAENFRLMLMDMRRGGIAHGDLQHGNLIIRPDGSIRLVDYDGMFVPALAGLQCHEVGHRNYQHPSRNESHFGPYLDNFAAWSIFTSLFCLSRDSSFMERLKGGDESLLFRQYDYRHPTKSRTFATLEQHDDADVQLLARKFRSMLSMAPDAVPYLDDEVADPVDLPRIQLVMRSAGSSLPVWILADDAEGDDDEDVDIRDEIDLSSVDLVVAHDDEQFPSLSQYMAALAAPAACFLDPELQTARTLRVEGRVRPYRRGRNAVFRLHRAARSFAVKVFLQPDPGIAARYNDFARWLRSERIAYSDVLKYIPRFEFQQEGIRVGGRVYPIVKMEWVEGRSLAEMSPDFVSDGTLESAKHQLRAMVQIFGNFGLIHGELDPSSVILSPEGLRVIDFDAVRVPGGKAPPAVSRGRLRHPQEEEFVDAYTDQLPAWVLDTCLVILREEPELRFSIAGDQFLIDSADIANPDESDILTSMANSKNGILVRRAELLRCLIKADRVTVPRLTSDASIDKNFAQFHRLGLIPVSDHRVSTDVHPIMHSTTQNALPTKRSHEVPVGAALAGFLMLFALSIAIVNNSMVVALAAAFGFVVIILRYSNTSE